MIPQKDWIGKGKSPKFDPNLKILSFCMMGGRSSSVSNGLVGAGARPALGTREECPYHRNETPQNSSPPSQREGEGGEKSTSSAEAPRGASRGQGISLRGRGQGHVRQLKASDRRSSSPQRLGLSSRRRIETSGGRIETTGAGLAKPPFDRLRTPLGLDTRPWFRYASLLNLKGALDRRFLAQSRVKLTAYGGQRRVAPSLHPLCLRG